jgi:hypothetical protein
MRVRSKIFVFALVLFSLQFAQNYDNTKGEYKKIYKNSYITFKTGGAFNLWFPDQPKRASISTRGYVGYTVSLTAKYKNYFRLYRLKYEAQNDIEPPKSKSRDQLIRENTGQTAYLLYHFLSDFFQFEKFYNMSIVLRAGGEDFKSEVEFSDDITYQPYNLRETGRIYYYSKGDKARFYTRFDEAFLGAAFGKFNERFYIGVGKLSYQKPYALQIGNLSIDDVLHDAKFTAVTFGGGVELKPKTRSKGGFSLSAFLHMGPGEIELIYKEISMSQIAEKFDSNVQYLGFDGEINYIRPIYKNWIYLGGMISVAGKTFKLQEPDDETYQEMSSMNNDFIIGSKFFLTLMF